VAERAAGPAHPRFAADAFAAAVQRAERLDFDVVKSRLEESGWPAFLANEVELEYRRLLVLCALYEPRTLATRGLVAEFAATHARTPRFAADLSTAGLAEDAPPPTGGAPAAVERTIARFERHFRLRSPGYWRVGGIDELGLSVAARPKQTTGSTC